MRLRDRLLLFSTAQLLVFGAVCALAYGAFQHAVLPMFEADDAIGRWAQHLAVGVALIWMVGLGYSLAMARSLVTPIRAMIDFARKVAGGALSDRLAIAAPGELAELRDYLNQIAAELERREADRQLAAAHTDGLQHELAAVSRTAGMAEIATGVLHNVGNVLNSLNVSVSMISDQVKGSRIAGLTRSIELVETYPGGLPAFLETEKGKVLPSYLSSVSKRLSEENAKVLEELGSVNRHVDHIKTIVAMQQSYARPSGIIEPIALSELVDDALHMGEPSFARHGIEIVKDYAADVTLVTDRHKLLQIMINLISNARHALKDHRADHAGAPPRPQQLIVRIRCGGDTTTIAVIDNGVGIPAENLAKIFRHGFTTKQDGHGFGLHASANTARELGGTIEVASDGPGHGAAFTLTLPAAIRQSHHDLGN
jgi:signal transduction histidine kinase